MGLKITVQVDTTVPSGGRIRVVNQSVTGPAGANGVGVPAGGTTGQVLEKASNTDYATQWANPAARVINTDGDPGYTVYVGSVDPTVSYSPATGDVWIEPS